MEVKRASQNPNVLGEHESKFDCRFAGSVCTKEFSSTTSKLIGSAMRKSCRSRINFRLSPGDFVANLRLQGSSMKTRISFFSTNSSSKANPATQGSRSLDRQ